MFGFSLFFASIKKMTAALSAVLIFLSSGATADITVEQMLVRGVAPSLLSVPSYSFYEPTFNIERAGMS